MLHIVCIDDDHWLKALLHYADLDHALILPPKGDTYVRLDSRNLYESADAVEAIREAVAASRQPEVDIIIIGNNRGAGYDRARGLIAATPEPDLPRLFDKTVIVWNDAPTERDTQPYTALGYRHFYSRRKTDDPTLREFIRAAAKAKTLQESP